MRRVMLLTVIAAMALGCVPALAQAGACGTQIVRGIWCVTCTGFVDLSAVDPRVPKNTLVPFSSLGREVIDADGNGKGKTVMSLGGTIVSVDAEATLRLNADCTGEKSYTLKAPGLSISGKATVVFLPHGQEFRVLLADPGTVVSCQYTKMYNTLLP